MAERKHLSKRKRFEIFRRDGFTCQYCGDQPPKVVLEIDHIHPVSKGGSNEEMNLVTACEACNRGKSDKEIGNVAPRPDADIEWLSMQQEIAELRRYQLAKQKRDHIIREIANDLTEDFIEISGYYWHPDEVLAKIQDMLNSNPPEWVEEAVMNVAKKVAGGYLGKYDWASYTYGILRNMHNER